MEPGSVGEVTEESEKVSAGIHGILGESCTVMEAGADK
jgi:hypothetical protein